VVVEYENNPRKFESVYSSKVKAGKRRTYFFDVRRTKGEDCYITLTESTKKFNDDGYERHKIFLYKEDFNRFVDALQDVVNHVKTELMPNYDYDEFTRRQQEWERKRDAGELDSPDDDNSSDDDSGSDDSSSDDDDSSDDDSSDDDSSDDDAGSDDEDTPKSKSGDDGDDMSW
jgi:hypothetical protein